MLKQWGLILPMIVAGASSAQASTLYLNSVAPTATVNVAFPGTGMQQAPVVGSINWSFDRADPSNAALDGVVSGNNLVTYCIEGTQNVYLNQTATFSTLTTAIGSTPQDNVGSLYQMGTHAAALSSFWDAYYGLSGLSDQNAAAFQMGIWEIVYDGTGGGLGTGNFQAAPVDGDATSLAAVNQAQDWLANLSNVNPSSHFQLYVLSDPTMQDQLFGVPTTGTGQTVPLPAALPVGGMLLAGLGVIRKLRRN